MRFKTESILIRDLQLIFNETIIFDQQIKGNFDVVINTSDSLNAEEQLNLVLYFYSNSLNKKNIVETQVKQPNQLIFYVTGFEEYKSLSTQLAPCGTYNGLNLFFKFTSHRINDFTLEFNLQLYLG